MLVEGTHRRMTTVFATAHLARGRRQWTLGLCGVGLAIAGLAGVLAGYGTATAAGQGGKAGATVVSVTAGRPGEFSFTLSKSSALPWQAKSPSASVTFKVTNKGALAHQFKVCTTALRSAMLNACRGTSTTLLKPGQSASLTVTFTHRGTYEYLSGIVAQAVKGMKGLIGIGVSLPTAAPAPTTTPSSAPPTTTTTMAPPSPATTTAPAATGLAGSAAAGAVIFNSDGCTTCHSISSVQAASGGNVDPNLNLTHSGGAFPDGPLSPQQIADIAAFVAG